MKKIRTKLTGFYTVYIAAVILTVGLGMYFLISHILLNNLQEYLVDSAEQGALTVETYISSRLNELKAIASNSLVSDNSLSCADRLKELKKQVDQGRFKRISITDVNGNAKTTDGMELYVGDRDYYRKALSGNSNVSDPITSRVDGTLVITFAVPIYNQEKVVGVLYATHDISVLSEITDRIRLGVHGSSFIIDKKGTTIAHDIRTYVYSEYNILKELEADKTLSKLINLERQMIAGNTGAGSYIYDNTEKYMGFSPIKGTQWSIAVTAPKSQVLSRTNTVLLIFIITILLITVLITAIVIYLNHIKKMLILQQSSSKRIIDVANVIVMTIKPDGTIVSYNKFAEIFFNKLQNPGSDELTNLFELLSKEENLKFIHKIDSIKNGESYTQYEPMCIEGIPNRYILWNINTSTSENEDILEFIGIDITERVESEKELQSSYEALSAVYEELAVSEEKLRVQFNELNENQQKINQLAYFDSLTGLPNRIMLYQEIERCVSQALTEKSKGALLYLDLDNFKYINDSFGHTVGDLLLVEIGKRLASIKGDKYFISRLGGDEFVILVKSFKNTQELEDDILKVMDYFGDFFTISENGFYTTVSCGVTIFPDDAVQVDSLLKNADTAMYSAKKDGKNKYSLFEKVMNDDITEKVNIENGLRRAIEKDEFLLHYQPQVDLESGRVCAFEALIRWMSPEYGLVPPSRFIDIAEETYLIVAIGKWALETACKFIKSLHNMGYKYLNISVNISAVQLIQPDFVESVLDILGQVGLEPHHLEIELTESVLIETIDKSMNKLQKLKKHGVKVAIDDFGKGYSSLSYLKQLPADTLKIDKLFIDDIGNKRNITGSIVRIARRVGLTVAAEGVETKEQLDYLLKSRCNIAQGYLISKPLPESEAINFIRKEN